LLATILLGTIAEPALTKALGEELDPDEVNRILTVLLHSDYEPAINAIARFATDSENFWKACQPMLKKAYVGERLVPKPLQILTKGL
jgi:hypothetical protein